MVGCTCATCQQDHFEDGLKPEQGKANVAQWSSSPATMVFAQFALFSSFVAIISASPVAMRATGVTTVTPMSSADVSPASHRTNSRLLLTIFCS